ncbi:hypothetical protein [Rhizobium rhizogenes]|uniref:hypothetical protein n=1 Tax=Rhizobium rhizogenes TaxID=359 RepID=UPI001572ACF2|nr:hypothetical protein [Rhizobium rhizogenes]NTG09235.1 hypothetical protein [Rhizobium rhizogenes]
MKPTIQSAGEAMPNSQGPEFDESRNPELLVMDAQNILSEIKHLNEAIFMAAHGIGNRDHMNAIATVTNLINEKMEKVESILDSARGAPQ